MLYLWVKMIEISHFWNPINGKIHNFLGSHFFCSCCCCQYYYFFKLVEFDFISFFATLCFMDFLFPRWGFFDILSCFSFLFLLHISQLKSCTILTIFNDKYVVAELLYCDIGNIYRKFSRDIIE